MNCVVIRRAELCGPIFVSKILSLHSCTGSCDFCIIVYDLVQLCGVWYEIGGHSPWYDDLRPIHANFFRIYSSGCSSLFESVFIESVFGAPSTKMYNEKKKKKKKRRHEVAVKLNIKYLLILKWKAVRRIYILVLCAKIALGTWIFLSFYFHAGTKKIGKRCVNYYYTTFNCK